MDVGACIYNSTMQCSDSPRCLIAHLDTLHIIAHPSVHLGHHQGDYTGATKRGVPCLLMLFSRRGFRHQLNGALSDQHCLLIPHTIRFTHSSKQINFCSFHLGNKKQITIQKSKDSLSRCKKGLHFNGGGRGARAMKTGREDPLVLTNRLARVIFQFGALPNSQYN